MFIKHSPMEDNHIKVFKNSSWKEIQKRSSYSYFDSLIPALFYAAKVSFFENSLYSSFKIWQYCIQKSIQDPVKQYVAIKYWAYQNSWTLDASAESRTLEAGLWALDAGCWTLNSGRWTLDSGRWTLDPKLWTLNSGRWTLNAGLWTLDTRPWTLDVGQWTVDVEHYTLDAGLWALDTIVDCFRTKSEVSFWFCMIKLLKILWVQISKDLMVTLVL